MPRSLTIRECRRIADSIYNDDTFGAMPAKDLAAEYDITMASALMIIALNDARFEKEFGVKPHWG